VIIDLEFINKIMYDFLLKARLIFSINKVNHFVRVPYVITQSHFHKPFRVLVEIVVELFIWAISKPHPNSQSKLSRKPAKLSLKVDDNFHI
jgi:hypothetical protein